MSFDVVSFFISFTYCVCVCVNIDQPFKAHETHQEKSRFLQFHLKMKYVYIFTIFPRWFEPSTLNHPLLFTIHDGWLLLACYNLLPLIFRLLFFIISYFPFMNALIITNIIVVVLTLYSKSKMHDISSMSDRINFCATYAHCSLFTIHFFLLFSSSVSLCFSSHSCTSQITHNCLISYNCCFSFSHFQGSWID